MPNDQKTKRRQFEELFLEQYQNLLNLGVSVCGQREFTKDTIQLLFLELWEKEIWKSDIHDFKAYLYKSFYRKLFYELKKQKKMEHAALEQLNEAMLAVSDEVDASGDLAELQERLKTAMEGLPKQQQEMIRLKYQSGLAYGEIAEITGKSKQTIYNQVHSSIKKLRARLTKSSSPLKKK